MLKLLNDYHIVLLSHAGKLMLKILWAKLQQYINQEIPSVQVGFRKGKGTIYQIANIRWIIKKENSRKKIYLCYINYAKAFDYVDHNKLWKILRDRNARPPYLVSWETCMWVNKQQLES